MLIIKFLVLLFFVFPVSAFALPVDDIIGTEELWTNGTILTFTADTTSGLMLTSGVVHTDHFVFAIANLSPVNQNTFMENMTPFVSQTPTEISVDYTNNIIIGTCDLVMYEDSVQQANVIASTTISVTNTTLQTWTFSYSGSGFTKLLLSAQAKGDWCGWFIFDIYDDEDFKFINFTGDNSGIVPIPIWYDNSMLPDMIIATGTDFIITYATATVPTFSIVANPSEIVFYGIVILLIIFIAIIFYFKRHL